jgi:anti-repressor protein
MMDDLVIMHNQEAVTTSLNVAQNFGKDHHDVLVAIDNLTRENSAVKNMIIEGNYMNSRGRSYRMVYLDRDAFTLLAMGFNGERALKFKLDYINAFNAMETKLKQSGGFNVPTSLPEALRLAADQAEQIEIMKPKAIFADAVNVSHTTILVGDLAKILRGNGINIGANRLFKWLRANGYLVGGYRTDRNMPTQKSMELGLFKVKETVVNHSDGHTSISKTPKVTGKGQQYFVNKFLKRLEA